MNRLNVNENLLHYLHHKQTLSVEQIAGLFDTDVGTVLAALYSHGIEILKEAKQQAIEKPRHLKVTKKWLHKQMVVRARPGTAVAKRLGISNNAVYYYVRKFGLTNELKKLKAQKSAPTSHTVN